jgi:hypothetical protein
VLLGVMLLAGGALLVTGTERALGVVLLGYFATRLQESCRGHGYLRGLATLSTMQVELLAMLDAGRDGVADPLLREARLLMPSRRARARARAGLRFNAER